MRTWLVLAMLFLASCGGSSTLNPPASGPASTGAASSSPSPSLATAAAITRVASEVFPPSQPPGPEGYVECEFAAGLAFEFTNCPVTPRFLARLQKNPSASDRVRPFCRCQNILPKRDITAESTASGGVAHVDLGNAQIDLLMTVDGGRLLVDDTQCVGGGAVTSYYVDPVAPC